jgi:hypothetical protein
MYIDVYNLFQDIRQCTSNYMKRKVDKLLVAQLVKKFCGPVWNLKVHYRVYKNQLLDFFYVVRTVHFGMKLYNDQRNARAFNLFIYLLLPYLFRAFF